MRRRRLRRLLVCLVLLAVLLVAGNEVATSIAESQLASRARFAARAASASATVGPFPVLAYILGQGRVPEVSVTLNDVSLAITRVLAGRVLDVPAQRLVLELHDVSVSRSDLVQHQDVVVTRIGSATATLTITAADLSAMVGLPVKLPGRGLIEIRIAGVTVTGSLEIAAGDHLVLLAAGRRVASLALRNGKFLSQCSLAIAFRAGKVVSSCTMSPVPQSLLDALGVAAPSSHDTHVMLESGKAHLKSAARNGQ